MMNSDEMITNETVLEALGWSKTLYEDEYTDEPLTMWTNPETGRKYNNPFELPDYFNSIYLALELRVTDMALTLIRYPSDPHGSAEFAAYYAPAGSVGVACYGDTASKAICLAWLESRKLPRTTITLHSDG